MATFGIGNLTYPGYSIWSLANNSKDEWKNNAGYWIQNGSYTNANQRTTDDAPKNTVSHGKPEGTSRFQARLDYNRKFGDHNVTAMLLYYMQNKIVNNEVPFRYMGMSARATYDYKNKYLFEFNLGYNGSENFARGHRFGVFPAGSIGWVVSQEEFMKNVSWIDHLKLRASFGLVGNDQMPDNLRFAYLQYYSSDDNMNIYFGENRKPYGTTLIEGVFANPSLTWEKARKFNFGIDAEFFHQRLTLSVDVFKEHRYDILTSLEDDNKLGFPYIVGQTAPIVNSGIVDNRGIEFQAQLGRPHRTAFPLLDPPELHLRPQQGEILQRDQLHRQQRTRLPVALPDRPPRGRELLLHLRPFRRRPGRSRSPERHERRQWIRHVGSLYSRAM